MKNKNRVITMSIIFAVLLTLIGTTLAYWSWEAPSEDQTRVTFTFDAAFTCSADAGGDITNNDVTLAPSTCDNSAYAIQREVKLSTTQATNTTIGLNMWLKINDIGSGLSQTGNFRYALTDSEDGCTNEMINDGNTNHVIASGTFQGTNNTTNSEIPLFTNKFYNQTTTNDTYYLYIWLDKDETSQTTQNQTFNITIGGECELFKDLVCEAGEYLPAGSETCTECPAGSFCPGWAGSYDGTEHGRTSCSTLGNGYTESYAGAAYQTECYMPKATLTGKYVATAGSASTNCTSGGYCPGTLDVFYGNTGGRTACTTLGSDYTGSAASSDEDTDCYIPAANLGGKYVATANSNAISCTAGYYCNSNTNISYGSTGGRTGICATGSYSAAGASSCTACNNGTTTSGTGQTSCNANCSNASGVYSWATASWSNGTVSNSCIAASCSTNYKRSGNGCAACGGGYYSSNGNTSTSCSTCSNSANVSSWSGNGCTISTCASGYTNSNNTCVLNTCTVYCTSTTSCSKTKPSTLHGVFTCTNGKTGSIQSCWYGNYQCDGSMAYNYSKPLEVCTMATSSSYYPYHQCNYQMRTDGHPDATSIKPGLGLSGSGYSCSC